ncbi:hypothetical protein BH11PSE8_BH11PSE8_39780 [soil metagenome]
MIDRLFFAALTLCLLIGGTLAIGSEMLGLNDHAAAHVQAQTQVIQLPRVVITGTRQAAKTEVADTERIEPAQQRVQ